MKNVCSMSRRTFITLVISSTAALIAPSLSAVTGKHFGVSQQSLLAEKIKKVFEISRASVIVRSVYSPVGSLDGSLEALTAEFCRLTGLKMQYLLSRTENELTNIIHIALQEDFHTGRVEILNGWVLSKTEVILCTICSSPNVSSLHL